MDESEFHKEATEKHDLNVIYKGDDLRINLKVM